MTDDLRLEYSGSVTSPALDNLSRGAYRDSYRAVTPTLATSRKNNVLQGIYLHCNSEVVVKRGTANVSRHYAIRRKWRNWHSNLDPANREQRLGGYSIDTGALAIDSGDKPLGEWFDAPGAILLHRQTQYERVLSEWVIGGVTSYNTLVQGLGGLYYFVILDLTPTHYRFFMSPSFDLTESVVGETLGQSGNLGPLPANGPWKTEADIAPNGWLAQHTTWQDYAALNNQLTPVTP